MLGNQPFEIVFSSGVARFDSVGNLFVNLPHSEDDPAQVRLAEDKVVTVPERRARVHGPGESGSSSGVFPASPDLPRGLTIEMKGFETATFADGKLVVAMPADTTGPDWFEAGGRHDFARPGNTVRLWVKSSLPDGVSLQGGDQVDVGPPTQPKPKTKPKTTPAPMPRPKAPKPPSRASKKAADKASSGPYRPERLPTGHPAAGADKPRTGLGCSTLLLAVALAVLALVAIV